jgi:hypothetical protein
MMMLEYEGKEKAGAKLIAMYRYCSIPPRYVVGVVEVPIEDTMNGAGGFTDKNAALNAFFLSGIPLTAMYKGGKLTTINMEYVRVEACLSMDRSPAAASTTSSATTNPSILIILQSRQYVVPVGCMF